MPLGNLGFSIGHDQPVVKIDVTLCECLGKGPTRIDSGSSVRDDLQNF